MDQTCRFNFQQISSTSTTFPSTSSQRSGFVQVFQDQHSVYISCHKGFCVHPLIIKPLKSLSYYDTYHWLCGNVQPYTSEINRDAAKAIGGAWSGSPAPPLFSLFRSRSLVLRRYIEVFAAESVELLQCER